MIRFFAIKLQDIISSITCNHFPLSLLKISSLNALQCWITLYLCIEGHIFLLSKIPDGKYVNNLRANEVNIKQTGSWECLHVLLNMHKSLYPYSFTTKCLLWFYLLLPRLICSAVLCHRHVPSSGFTPDWRILFCYFWNNSLKAFL